MADFDVKIRYNTKAVDDKKCWRVIIDSKEYLADEVLIRVPTATSKDFVFDEDKEEWLKKHHISCRAKKITWKKDGVIIS